MHDSIHKICQAFETTFGMEIEIVVMDSVKEDMSNPSPSDKPTASDIRQMTLQVDRFVQNIRRRAAE